VGKQNRVHTSAHTSKLKFNALIKKKLNKMSIMQVCYHFWSSKLVDTILSYSETATRVVEG
jgi:hypothetical protein